MESAFLCRPDGSVHGYRLSVKIYIGFINFYLKLCQRKHRVLVGNPEGKRPLGRPRRGWVDDIKMDLRDVGWGDIWINLAQNMD
jgi:hypothetical protein